MGVTNELNEKIPKVPGERSGLQQMSIQANDSTYYVANETLIDTPEIMSVCNEKLLLRNH